MTCILLNPPPSLVLTKLFTAAPRRWESVPRAVLSPGPLDCEVQSVARGATRVLCGAASSPANLRFCVESLTFILYQVNHFLWENTGFFWLWLKFVRKKKKTENAELAT